MTEIVQTRARRRRTGLFRLAERGLSDGSKCSLPMHATSAQANYTADHRTTAKRLNIGYALMTRVTVSLAPPATADLSALSRDRLLSRHGSPVLRHQLVSPRNLGVGRFVCDLVLFSGMRQIVGKPRRPYLRPHSHVRECV